jgi:serine/threonine protein kinase
MAKALQDRLYSSRIEWPLGQNKYFIPVDDLDSLITYENVKNELRRLGQSKREQDLSSYANIICSNAKKIFAVLLYVDRIEPIFRLIDDGICDEELPFTRCYKSSTADVMASAGPFTLCRRSRKCHRRANHRDCGIREITNWSQRAIGDFCRDQWLAQAPVFQKLEDGSIPHYDLNDNVILPFIEDHELQSNQKVSSGYSHVWAVKIHPAHQNLYYLAQAPVSIYLSSSLLLANLIKENAPLLAIKRPFSINDLDFKRETDMLSALAKRDHPHLIRLLATYKFKGYYHLVFPHATSNLRGYWNQAGMPQWDRKTFLWSLNQLRGIASGLNEIHNFNAIVPLGSQPANQALQIPSGGMLKVDKSEEMFGRHGDIKPENILWFNEFEGVSEKGILQIADMGLGRFHRLDSRSKVNPLDVSGSPTYSPPEIALGLPVSRAYDIWSLGCVFLEFITWLLEGGSSIDAFASARDLTISPGMNDDTFYTVSMDTDGEKYAELRKGVKTWIDLLRQNQRCSQMVGCILDLVQNRLLVIDSKSRIRADQLVLELEKFLDQARKDAVYLLGQNRPDFRQSVGMMKLQDNHHPLSTAGHFSDNCSTPIDTDQFLSGSPTTSPSIRIQQY